MTLNSVLRTNLCYLECSGQAIYSEANHDEVTKEQNNL